MGSEGAPKGIAEELLRQFPGALGEHAGIADGVPTLRVGPADILGVLRYLKEQSRPSYPMLYDLTAVDDRYRRVSADFTIVYHLFSFDLPGLIRIKVPLRGAFPHVPSAVPVWPSANWYEREVYDLFGIVFDGHPNLRRILMPVTWTGHPLRKDHPARATELPDYQLSEEQVEEELDAYAFKPEEWGMEREGEDTDFMFLNMGPNHPGTHGLFRIVLQLDGEEVLGAVPDIGYHHRGIEKMAERQTWHSFIPYASRTDYLGGVVNDLAYVSSVEALAGIRIPDRALVIRVMLAEMFRISSHLVWYGTFAQDLGALSPIFFMFGDREEVLDIIQAITGGRMHPGWLRIGGTAQDLPDGWAPMVRDFIGRFGKHLDQYEKMVMRNRILKARTRGVGAYDTKTAIEWGVTGPGLRATGFSWDFRKNTPYGGYDRFEFEVPVGSRGDCYDRGLVHIEELRQSTRIIEQCLNHMPSGPYKSDHPLTTPPPKERTMKDIETLIHHFVGVTWGPVMPAGEAMIPTEATKGSNAYYAVSDGGIRAYRLRVRAPSFAHLQLLPVMSRGSFLSDMIAIVGSIDFVMGDVDR